MAAGGEFDSEVVFNTELIGFLGRVEAVHQNQVAHVVRAVLQDQVPKPLVDFTDHGTAVEYILSGEIIKAGKA
jgi:hypothetical protein